MRLSKLSTRLNSVDLKLTHRSGCFWKGPRYLMPPLSYTAAHVGLRCVALSESPLHSLLRKIVFQEQGAGARLFPLWLPLVTQKIYSSSLFAAGSKAAGLLFEDLKSGASGK